MKQYVPLKPIKRGFKVWVVADGSNGYFLDLQVYVGKEGEAVEHGLGERVVLDLTQQFWSRNHHVFCDNYFTSPHLFWELLEHGVYACGTVRQDRRDFPGALRGIHLARGTAAFRQSSSLTAVVWQDKRPVSVLSTLPSPDEMKTVPRRARDGSRVEVSCPSAILTYTKYMRGVDLGDQLRKYYSVRLKCNKNYKYIFWFLFDVCVTNAFILSKFCTLPTSIPTSKEERRLKAFRIRLANNLIGTYNSRQRAGRRSSRVVPEPTPVLPPFHSPHHHDRQRCVYCRVYRNPPRRKESVWQCMVCEGAPTLCLTGRDDGTNCWDLWHAQVGMETDMEN